MSAIWTLDDLEKAELEGRRVFVRVDFNVPLDGDKVLDRMRLEAALPTLRELIECRARLVLASHCGRPKGRIDPRFSLKPVVTELAALLGQPVRFAADCVGSEAIEAIEATAPGEVVLLENLRFHPGEKANDPQFADQLAALADVFIGDAFGAAHRAHASVVGVAERVRTKAAGRLMAREVEALGGLLGEPKRPFVAILGGAKIEGKIETLENLLPRLDGLILGGGMANTFLAARGHDLAKSLVETDRIGLASEILERAEQNGTDVLLPDDVVVTDDLDEPGRIETVDAGAIPAGLMAVDVGPRSRERFIAKAKTAGTLFWNGPLGVFEKPPFHEGTQAVANALTACPGFTVIGGGETVAAVRRTGAAENIGHVSTGGGASLELLAGKTLPGVAALSKGASS